MKPDLRDSKQSVLKHLLMLGVVAGLIGLTTMGWHLHQINEEIVLDGSSETVTLQIPAGSHFQAVVLEMQQLGLVRSSVIWRLYGRIFKPTIKAGEYRFMPGEAFEAWLNRMLVGDVVRHRFTLVEGWNIRQLRAALAGVTPLAQEAKDWSDERVMEALGCVTCSAEGVFLPETYLYERGDSDLSLLSRAKQAMEHTLTAAWASRDPDLPLNSPEELLVLASLIEKETGVPEERGTIAGVFVRRLERGMRLQTDPTVIYGLGEAYNGNLTRVHLRTDHPWNTYTRHGLPPTPIAMPGVASLQAAARPSPGDALYFVSRGDGTHVFSRTLEEHNTAVNRYIRGR